MLKSSLGSNNWLSVAEVVTQATGAKRVGSVRLFTPPV